MTVRATEQPIDTGTAAGKPSSPDDRNWDEFRLIVEALRAPLPPLVRVRVKHDRRCKFGFAVPRLAPWHGIAIKRKWDRAAATRGTADHSI